MTNKFFHFTSHSLYTFYTMYCIQCKQGDWQIFFRVLNRKLESDYNRWWTGSPKMQTMQTSVKCVVLFVIYPQAAQTQHLTIDLMDNRISYTLYWKFPLLVINILKSNIKLNFHISWAQIASIFDGFVVLILLSNLFLLSCCFCFCFFRFP